ncbi:MAG: hypothetical protein ACI4RF_01885, partial [Eubacterium sp.]
MPFVSFNLKNIKMLPTTSPGIPKISITDFSGRKAKSTIHNINDIAVPIPYRRTCVPINEPLISVGADS